MSHQDLLIFQSDRPENCDRGYLQDFSTPSLPTTTCDNSLRKTLGCPMIFDDMGQFAGKTDATTSLFLNPLPPPNMRPLEAAPRHPRGLVARQRARLQEPDFVPGHSAMSPKTTCEKRGGFQNSLIFSSKYILNGQSKTTTQERKIVDSFERSASCGV